MIYLLTAIGQPPGGSSTVHIYTHTHTQYTERHKSKHRTTQKLYYYYIIYLLTAVGLTPGGSSTVHIYTHTHTHNTQNDTNQNIEQHKNFIIIIIIVVFWPLFEPRTFLMRNKFPNF